MDRWDFLWRPLGCSANGMGVGAHHPNNSGIPLIIVDDDGGIILQTIVGLSIIIVV